MLFHRLSRQFSNLLNSELKLSFSLPHRTIFKEKTVYQVNLSTSEGDLGILANHVPTILQLKPGLIEIFENDISKKSQYFCSGGFAIVNPDSTMQITATEAVPLDQLDSTEIDNQNREIQKLLSSPTVNEIDRIQLTILNECYQSMINALGKMQLS